MQNATCYDLGTKKPLFKSKNYFLILSWVVSDFLKRQDVQIQIKIRKNWSAIVCKFARNFLGQEISVLLATTFLYKDGFKATILD